MKLDAAERLQAWTAGQQVLAEPGAGVGDGGSSGQSPLPSCVWPYLPTVTGLQVQPIAGSPPCWRRPRPGGEEPPPSRCLHPTLNSQAEQGREQQIWNQHWGASPGIPSPSRSRSLSKAAFSSGSHGSLCSQQLPSWAFRPPVQHPPDPGAPGLWDLEVLPPCLCTGVAHVTGPDAAPGPCQRLRWSPSQHPQGSSLLSMGPGMDAQGPQGWILCRNLPSSLRAVITNGHKWGA